jgi:hypothetical protein
VAATPGFVTLVRRHYDKLVAFVAVTALLLAIAKLAMNKRVDAVEDAAYAAGLDALKPAHPTLEPINLVTYSNALRQLASPYRIALNTNRLSGFFVPESRVWCANRACRFPIPRSSTNCPVCQTPQPREREEDPEYDGDGGGIPDQWEIQYGLDPLDPADDVKDSDGDGFNNLAEYKANTDPLDPKSHPDLLALIRVAKIDATRLPMKFMGVTEMPNASHRIQINVWEAGKQQPDTYFVVTNQMIGKTDFKLLRLIEKVEKRINKVTGTPMNHYERSIQIGRGNKVKTLKLGENASEDDYKITFVQTLDGTRFEVAGDGEFKVGEKKYRVIAVDNQAASVVLRSDADKLEITVPKL